MYQCESQKYDMEFEVRKRGFEVKIAILMETPSFCLKAVLNALLSPLSLSMT